MVILETLMFTALVGGWTLVQNWHVRGDDGIDWLMVAQRISAETCLFMLIILYLARMCARLGVLGMGS